MIKLSLDTSTPTTVLKLDDKTYEWTSGRDLASGLLTFIHDKLTENGKDWHDLTALQFFTGPGSFTGLRIGATVINTLAQELGLKITDQNGNLHQIVLPKYGKSANTTSPK